MIDKNKLDNVLWEIRVSMAKDIGDFELYEIKDRNTVILKLKGACPGCPMSKMTLKMIIEQRLKEKMPEIERIITF